MCKERDTVCDMYIYNAYAIIYIYIYIIANIFTIQTTSSWVWWCFDRPTSHILTVPKLMDIQSMVNLHWAHSAPINGTSTLPGWFYSHEYGLRKAHHLLCLAALRHLRAMPDVGGSMIRFFPVERWMCSTGSTGIVVKIASR